MKLPNSSRSRWVETELLVSKAKLSSYALNLSLREIRGMTTNKASIVRELAKFSHRLVTIEELKAHNVTDNRYYWVTDDSDRLYNPASDSYGAVRACKPAVIMAIPILPTSEEVVTEEVITTEVEEIDEVFEAMAELVASNLRGIKPLGDLTGLKEAKAKATVAGHIATISHSLGLLKSLPLAVFERRCPGKGSEIFSRISDYVDGVIKFEQKALQDQLLPVMQKNQYVKYKKRIGQIVTKLAKTKSSIQRTQWLDQFGKLYNASKAVVSEATDPTAAEAELREAVTTLAHVIFDRGQENALQSSSAFSDLSSISLKYKEVGPDSLLVNFSDDSAGRQELGLSVIASALKVPEIVNQTRIWEFDRSGISSGLKDSEKLWETVAAVCIQYGYITIANNGSRMLLQIADQNGDLSRLGKFLDSLFENFSEIGAYGLSLINAKPVSRIGSDHDKPINSNWDEQGRDCKCILFDSRITGVIPGTDGGTVNNFGYIGQHRSFSVNGKSIGAFFKGFAAAARFTMINGDLHTINDIVNLKELTRDELENSDYTGFVDEITSYKRGAEVSEGLENLMNESGDYLLLPSNPWEESNYRIQRWDDWFDSNIDLPYVMAYEVGQLKGKGKRTFHELVESLAEQRYSIDEGGKCIIDANGTYKPKKVGEFLQALGGVIEITSPVYGWSIIDAPEKSSTSLNFQPMAAAIVDPFKDGEYEKLMEDCLEKFERKENSAENLLIDQIVGGLTGQKVTVKYPKAVVKNAVGDFWRFFTNAGKNTCPTRRILMVDKGFRGLVLVEDDCHQLYNQAGVQMPTAMSAWRSPLIVPSAIQAPIALSRSLAIRILNGIRRGDKSESNQEAVNLLVARISFKQKVSREKASEMLPIILEEMIKLAELLVLDSTYVVMDVSDVEDMQGDDDGDTVTVDFEKAFVAICQNTEWFWHKFHKVNNLRPTKIEMSKANQINFGKANGIYGGEELDDDQKEFIELFGVECPVVAKAYNMDTTKIPSPLGLNCGLLVEMNKKTGGELFKDAKSLSPILFKLGSTPLGPVGAGSNGAPDLLIRALAQTDENLVLNPYGRRLWQGYCALGSTVQVSIDWAKRVYDILCLALYDQVKEDGSWLMDFEDEITPEKAKAYLVKNAFSKIWIVSFKKILKQVDPGSGKSSVMGTFGTKMLRVVVSEDEKFELLPSTLIQMAECDPAKIYRLPHESCFETLKGIKEDAPIPGAPDYFVQGRPQTKEVNLMNASNACFDFESIYSIGAFMIQEPLGAGFLFADTQIGLAAWKKDLKHLLESHQDPGASYLTFHGKAATAYAALNQSSKRSALVRNALAFMNYYASNPESPIKEIMDYGSKLKQACQGSGRGRQLDPYFNGIYTAVATYYSENYRTDGDQLSKGMVIKAIFAELGLDVQASETMLSDINHKHTLSKGVEKVEFDIIDLIACLFRNDPKVGDQDFPQCLAQLVIGEVLERSETNLFEEITVSLEGAVLEKFHDRFKPFKNNHVLPSRLNKYVTNNRFDDVQEVLEDLVQVVERQDNRTGQSYHSWEWCSEQSMFEGLARILDYGKNSILTQEDFKAYCIKQISVKLLEEDAVVVARQFIAALKAGVANPTQLGRKLRSYSKMTEYPTALLDRNNAFDNTKDIDVPDLHPKNVFRTRDLSVQGLLLAIMQAQKLSNAQYSRSTQYNTICALAQQGCLLKSYTFFGNAGVKYPADIACMHFMAQDVMNNMPVNIRNNRLLASTRVYRNWTVFKQLGLKVDRVEKVLKINHILDDVVDVQNPIYTLNHEDTYGSGNKLFRLSDVAVQFLSQQGYPMTNLSAEIIRYEADLKSFTGHKSTIFVKKIAKSMWVFEGRNYFDLEELKIAIRRKFVL